MSSWKKEAANEMVSLRLLSDEVPRTSHHPVIYICIKKKEKGYDKLQADQEGQNA